MLVARGRGGGTAMTARDAIRLGTRGGAAVLRRDDIGSLEPGKCADFAVWRTDGLELARRRRPRCGHRLRRPPSRRPPGRRRRGRRPRRRPRQRRRGRDRAGASRPSANVHGMSASLSTHVLDTAAGTPGRRRHRRAAARRRADRARARPTPTAAPASPRRSSSGATGSSSTRRPRSSAGSSSSSSSMPTATTTCPSSSPRSRARATAAAERRGARRALRGQDAVRRAARRARRSARARARRDRRCSRMTRSARCSTPTRRSGRRRACRRDRRRSRAPTPTPTVLAELARLNAEYEARHGFRFVVFVNRRPKAEILEVLKVRIDNPTDAELETALARARRDRDRPLAARMTVASLPRPVLDRLAQPADPLAARDRRDRVDRRLDLLRPARPVARGAEERGRRARRRPRRAVGGPRRRLLPRQEVQGRAARAARPPRVVQVGGVHDVALGLRADGRPLLLQRERVPDRPVCRRPQLVGGGRHQHRACSSSPGSSTTSSAGSSLPRGRNGEIALWALLIAADDARRLGLRQLFQPRAAFLQVGAMLGTIMAGERLLQHHPGALGADQRQEGGPRARPDAGHRRQAALGPQQLLHAARAVHDARRALRVRLRRRRGLARPDRDHAARRADPGLLQPPPPGPHDLGAAGASASSASLLLAVASSPDDGGERQQPGDGRVRARWRR